MSTSIKGSARLRLGDHLSWFFASGACLKMGILTGLSLGALMLIKEQFFGAGLSSTGLVTAGIAIVFVPTITVPLTLAIQIIWFMRLNAHQRNMTWDLTETGVCLYDAAGNKVLLPWSQVKQVGDRKTGFLLQTKPSGSRWIPKRAFESEELLEIKKLAINNLQRGE